MSDSAQIVELDAARPGDKADPYAPRKTSGGTTFKLRKELMAHTPSGPQNISEITLREPNADDYFAAGGITTAVLHGTRTGDGQKTELRVDATAVRNWLARLSGYDAGVIGQMGLRDTMVISNWLQSQFGDGDKTEE